MLGAGSTLRITEELFRGPKQRRSLFGVQMENFGVNDLLFCTQGRSTGAAGATAPRPLAHRKIVKFFDFIFLFYCHCSGVLPCSLVARCCFCLLLRRCLMPRCLASCTAPLFIRVSRNICLVATIPSR